MTKKGIHQLLPSYAYGDAIGNQVTLIRDLLIEQGYDSTIYSLGIEDKVKQNAEYYKEGIIPKQDGLIYHHAISFPQLAEVISYHRGKRALIYHNITPPDFFKPYSQNSTNIVVNGRKELTGFSDIFSKSYGVSNFNVKELAQYGIKADKLPLIVSGEKWQQIIADDLVLTKYQDGKKNILFTGRFATSKKQEDLLELLFNLKKVYQNVRLILVGTLDPEDLYCLKVQKAITDFNLENDVVVTGHVSEEALKAYFLVADLYLSMSEHEGFGVPLIEAMWFDIPVIAYDSSAIAETLDSAALLFTNKKDMAEIAGLTYLMLTDENIRQRMIKEQKKVREKYSYNTIKPQYLAMIKQISE